MKKILSLAFALIFALTAFAACGNGSQDKDAQKADAPKAKLTMATNAEFPPYEYHENDSIVGIDADIAKAIADKLGMELEIVDTDFNSIIPGVQSKKYDMGMAGMTVSEERLKSVDFSDSYATGIQVVIVNENSAIKSVDDLFADGADNTIGVQEATTGDIYTSEDIEAAGLGKVNRYNRGADAIQALVAGKIDCVVIDNEPAKQYVKANPGLKILETEYAAEDYAICFSKGNTELKDKVNGALKELIADGSVQKILDKYISAE